MKPSGDPLCGVEAIGCKNNNKVKNPEGYLGLKVENISSDSSIMPVEKIAVQIHYGWYMEKQQLVLYALAESNKKKQRGWLRGVK